MNKIAFWEVGFVVGYYVPLLNFIQGVIDSHLEVSICTVGSYKGCYVGLIRQTEVPIFLCYKQRVNKKSQKNWEKGANNNKDLKKTTNRYTL